MTKIGCADLKDVLPEWIRGELDESDRAAVSQHVASCSSCSEEAELLRRIQAAELKPPASLASEIKLALAANMDGAARDDGWGRRLGGWRLSAAATVVLALGTAVIWQRMQAPLEVGPLGQEPFAVLWPSDDADVAGVPLLEDLSDEDLALLLEELGG